MNVLELAQRHVALKRTSATKGGEYTGACPGCGDAGHDSRSGPPDRFHVWPEDRGGAGGYWCRRCGKAGDSIQYLMDFEGKTYPEACAALGISADDKALAPRTARVRPAASGGFTPKPHSAPAELWREKAEKLVAAAHEALLSPEASGQAAAALKWLAARGIDTAAIERFRVGWIEQNVFRPREAWGLETVLKDDGVTPKKLFIPRGILIPSLAADGSVFHLQVRRLKADIDAAQGQKKYYIVPGSQPQPMVAGDEQKAFVVVETKLDAALVAHVAGDLVSAVAMVSSSNKPDEGCHRMLSAAACILVALDFDSAGKAGWDFWKQTYQTAERWPVPDGKDPGEAFEMGVDLRAWILAGLPPAWHVGPAAMTPRGHRPAQEESQNPAPDGVPQETINEQPTELRPESAPVDSGINTQEPATADPGGAVRPASPSVRELGAILARYPVRVRATAQRTTLLPGRGFRNDEILGRASRLVFFDAACWRYLHDHPEDVIDGKNFSQIGG